MPNITYILVKYIDIYLRCVYCQIILLKLYSLLNKIKFSAVSENDIAYRYP